MPNSPGAGTGTLAGIEPPARSFHVINAELRLKLKLKLELKLKLKLKLKLSAKSHNMVLGSLTCAFVPLMTITCGSAALVDQGQKGP